MCEQQENLADLNPKCEQKMQSKGPLGYTPSGVAENTDLTAQQGQSSNTYLAPRSYTAIGTLALI